MGDVWRATDLILERTVAVKMMRRELVEEPGFADRFLIEARTMAAISHPGVVAIHDYRGDDASAFLVMEYVEGEALSRRLHRFGKLDPVRTMHLIAQAADALHAAHERGVVHRDIKPGNLLVNTAGSVVLTDFGIARSAASTPLTATGAVVGTPSYLAPEQVLGKPATARTDVYALGVVAYECLAGRRPFDGDNPFEIAMKRLREPPPTLAVATPPPVLLVVEKALAADPDQRWQTAAELAAAARQAVSPDAATAAGSPSSGPPASGSPASGPPSAGSPASGPPAAGSPSSGPPAAGSPASGSAGPPRYTPARVSVPPAGPAPAAPPVPTILDSRSPAQPPPPSPMPGSLPPRFAPAPPAHPGTPPPSYPLPPSYPPSPVPAAMSPPPPWRRPTRPVLVSVACALLLVSAAALALYFGGTLRALGTYVSVYERHLFREGQTAATETATAVGAVAGVVAGTGLVIAVVLLLLVWPTYLGKRGARGWVFTLGGFVLLCCGGPIALDSFGDGLGSLGSDPAARIDLQQSVVASMPGWYETVTGPLPVTGLAALLVALFLLSTPPAARFFARPRPLPYRPAYPQYPRYYGYPPGR